MNRKLLSGDPGIRESQHCQHLSNSFCVAGISNCVIFQLWLGVWEESKIENSFPTKCSLKAILDAIC